MNESIRAREVRAVFPDGTAEIMPTAQALRRAQEARWRRIFNDPAYQGGQLGQRRAFLGFVSVPGPLSVQLAKH